MIATVLRARLSRSGKTRSGLAEDDNATGLCGEVGADASQRDPGVGLRQRRSVVDPVADHGDATPRRASLLDPASLVRRQEFRGDGVGVDPLRHRPRGRLAVAGQDGDLLDLQVPEVVDHIVGFGADRVVDADDARHLAIDRDDQRSLTACIELAQDLLDVRIQREIPCSASRRRFPTRTAWTSWPGAAHRAWTPAPGNTVASIGSTNSS